MIRAYLSGASKALSDNGASWRENMEYWLKQYDLTAFNPNKHYDYKKQYPSTTKECMTLYLEHLKRCDIVIVNLDNTDKSVGTGAEIGYALALNKPIYGFKSDMYNETIYDWIAESCWKIFNSEIEVAEYIAIHY